MKKMLAGALILLVGLSVGWFIRNRPADFVPAQNIVQEAKKFPATFGGQITMLDGNVEYKEAKGVWKRAESNLSLREGDSVEVLGEGRVVIVLDDGSAVRLGSNSSVTLNTLQAGGITVTNVKGQVYTRVVKAERPFFVRARTVVYQSMGTAYKTINEDDRQGVEVYESKVKVLGATGEEVVVDSGSKFDVVNVKDKKIEKKLAMLDKKEIKNDKFVQWNKEQDESSEEFKDELGILDDLDRAEVESEVEIEKVEHKESLKVEEKKIAYEKKEDKTAEIGSVTALTIKNSGVNRVSWSLAGYSKKGFKVVWSKESMPTYPTRSNDKYNYLAEPSARTSELDAFDGPGVYYVRVCEYLGGSCGKYSNQITLSLSDGDSAAVNSIMLTAGNGLVSWNIDGYSKNGFKVVWSKNSGPTYPTRDGDTYNYLSDPAARSSELSAFDGSGNYFVRVCEYLGGKCGQYSNQVQVSL